MNMDKPAVRPVKSFIPVVDVKPRGYFNMFGPRKTTPEEYAGEMPRENNIFKLGDTFATVEDVLEAINKLSDETLCRWVTRTNFVRRFKRRMLFKCTFGEGRKSRSKGIYMAS